MGLLERGRHPREVICAVAGLLLEQVVQRDGTAARARGAGAGARRLRLAARAAGGQIDRKARRRPQRQEISTAKAPLAGVRLVLRHLTLSRLHLGTSPYKLGSLRLRCCMSSVDCGLTIW